MPVRSSLAAAGLILIVAARAGPAIAGCTANDGIVNCSGNLGTGVSFQQGYTSLTVANLTAPIAPNAIGGIGVALGFVGQSGGNIGGIGEGGNGGIGLTLSFAGSPYAITSPNGGGVSVSSVGGNGGDGTARHPFVGDSHGNPGGLGGSGGAASLTFSSGSVTASGYESAGVQAYSQGGYGGNGGSIEVDTFGNSHGGFAGNGGGAGAVTITIAQGTFTQQTAGFGAVQAFSNGGNGGNGGEGDGHGGAGYGGFGGSGGAGGTVAVSLGAVTITETGGTGAAILAQSVGGAGGTGAEGFSSTADGNGGDGGAGGNGGNVAVIAGGTANPGVLAISTNQQYQHGVQAGSFGGAGGDGGQGKANTIKGSGGNGGVGGAGGGVTVNLAGATIGTSGTEALGVYARSYGGAGGNGGPGDGGSGHGGADSGSGPGGAVSVTYSGTIATTGVDAGAIFAQSVGGFSGNGGGAAGFVAYGASDQSAGNGGNVSVTVQGASSTIATQGDWSTGITAQSVGGGGGKGTAASGVVSIGGTGAAGGDGGTASISNAAAVTTLGDGAGAIYAGSHGGGGGDGGGAGGVVSIGGKAGSGGNGGQVGVTNAASATLQTSGDGADGIDAFSVGGGGGSAHSTSGLVAIGGRGGGGGTGNVATVKNDGSIATRGQDADGAFVQSIGGGGGAGSNAIGVGALFSLAIGGDGGGGGGGNAASYSDSGIGGYRIDTVGDRARGIVVQSVGGGGGDGGSAISASASPALSISVGASGSGALGGSAGNVSASTSATAITTQGASAAAILVQSTGGGGGNAGTTVAAAEGMAFTENVAVGGHGGAGGDAGSASASASGQLSTKGDLSPGIYVESVGGGGGHAGTTVAAGGVSSLALTANVGGYGGAAGNAGAVTATSTGSITTAGASSYGIHAVSVGGGGGASQFAGSFAGASGVSIAATVGGKGGAGGDGDTVNVTAKGSIATGGESASGIAAMSIGGGGGDSGTTITATGISGGAIGVTVGGSAGASGSGAAVTVDNAANITTAGKLSEGIRAHSIASGGGNAGAVANASAVAIGDIGVGVGGNGGGGGNAGDVTVSNLGNIATLGEFASAIDAKSLAGGGGNAKGTITTSGVSMGNLSASVGGNGGAGGIAGTVAVTSNAALATTGNFAYGIIANSAGGGGGEAGYAVEAGFNAGEVSGSLNVNVGGVGGNGGKAGSVTIDTQGSIKTEGFGSDAIAAQSIGGKGGMGGAIYSGNLAISSSGSAQITANYGGNGGSGGLASAVQVGNAANILTEGYFANGIVAQSIGGDGGAGGSTYTVTAQASPSGTLAVTASVGGLGGTGNHASTVNVNNTGTITTTAGGSIGIDASSIGGGGGNGGNAAAINVDLSGSGAGNSLSGNINIGVGGTGGAGGNGDAVTVQNGGAIATSGMSSYGIVAESIGGGGGSGGTTSAVSFGLSGICKLLTGGTGYLCKSSDNAPDSTTVKLSLSVQVGGSGGAAGDGGKVTVGNTAAITTNGDTSHAIYAKSIGGGGGHGGEGSMGIAAWTTNEIAKNLVSYGKTFTSLPRLTSISVAVGGSGGASGVGGEVDIENSATLTTSGKSSYGIHAQSVGGGGGDGGTAAEGLWGKVGVGGHGSGGGDGGTVKVTSPGAIKTTGDGSVGIFAQSVGGGGGTAGNVEKGFYQSWINLNIGVGVAYQENPGMGGDGGAVTVTSGAITTTGETAHGVVAQSVGGSGGVAGISGDFAGGPFSYAGSVGDPGKGGAVTVTVGGAIAVAGANAEGVFAQSVSGKGDDDTSSNVTINANADIRATGSGGRAILAQSQGNASNGSVLITVAKGVTLATGADGAETIGIKDGANNLVTNYGTITQGNASSYAIRADGSSTSTQVQNYGTINGSVLGKNGALLTGETGAPSALVASGIDLHNLAGGVINAGSVLDVSTLSNLGTLVVGGAGTVGTTRVTGNLTQGAGGVLAVDLDPRAANGAGLADKLAIDGRAELGGRVTVNLLDSWQPLAGPHTVPIVVAGGGIAAAGVDVKHSAVAQYKLDTSTPGTLALGYDIDFANPGILAATNDNQDRLARHLHDAYRAHALDDDTVRKLIAIEDNATFARAMNSFSAEVAVDNQIISLLTSMGFADTLSSCAERNGNWRWYDEGRCGWMTVRGTRYKRDATSDNLGFGNTSWQIAGGAQFAVGDDWYVGGGLAWDHRSLSVNDSNVASSGDGLQGGILALRRYGAAEFSGALTAAYGRFDNTRTLWDGSAASATEKIGVVAGQLRAAYLFPVGTWAIKPRIDLGVQYVTMDGFDEAGGSGFRMSVARTSDTYTNVQPAIDFATEIETADGTLIRPKLTLGVTQFLGNATPSVSGRLALAPGDVAPFTTSTAIDKTRFDIGATVDLFVRKDVSLRADAFGSFSDNSTAYGGGIKFAVAF
jgi:hypothetical protein